jgi:dipeptidyl-peptidase-4
MKKIFLISLLVLSSLLSHPQDKLLTMEDALVKNRTVLAPATLPQLQFVYNSSEYVFLGKEGSNQVWMKGNGINSDPKPFLRLAELNNKLRKAAIDTVQTMPAIKFNESSFWVMTINGSKVALDPLTNKVKVLVPKSISGKDNIQQSNTGAIAYTDNYDLYVFDGKESNRVTTDGSANILYGTSVHRDEFGISKGLFWSNNGNHLAFYRMDQTMVTDYPVIDWSQRPAKNVNIKYPMAGDKSHHVKLGVYNTSSRQTVWMNTAFLMDNKKTDSVKILEQYLTNVAWSPDDRYVYVAVLNREQNHMRLNQYDARTGQLIKTLFEEKDNKYVEPLVPMLFLKNDPSRFIWQSNRDGWNHLYLYDSNGRMLKQLTTGEWQVMEVKGFDNKGTTLFYTSTKESPLTRNLYALDINTGLSRLLTADTKAVHTTQVSTDGSYIIDNYSYIDIPRKIELVETRSGKHKLIFSASDPLAGFKQVDRSVFSIRGDENEQLYCRMFKPSDFDSNRQYPVIVYVYGGPHVQLVTNGWNANASDYWGQYMAQRGYVVFTLDTRGSANRGKAFEQSVFRKLGEAQVRDVMSGVDWLKSKPWIDSKNMALFGWSFGGFLTTDFMLTHPDVFKTAVAGGPVIDWSYYEIMYTERYMDTPQENPEGYAATDLTRKIGNLKGRLLLIHGQQDPVVVQQHSVRLVRAAIDKNVQVDYMIYPGHEHNVLGKDRAHLYQKVTDYLERKLF